jgi:hypothetical protein
MAEEPSRDSASCSDELPRLENAKQCPAISFIILYSKCAAICCNQMCSVKPRTMLCKYALTFHKPYHIMFS